MYTYCVPYAPTVMTMHRLKSMQLAIVYAKQKQPEAIKKGHGQAK